MTERPARRGSYHHGALPEALVAAAFEVLDEQGLGAVSMREVARRAGVSAGAPFRHFADRQALLTELADQVLADFERWQRAEIEGSEGSALRAIGLGFVRYAIRHPHRFELVRARVFTPSRQPELQRRLSGIDEAFTGFIVADQEAGRLRPGDPALVGLAGQALVYGLSQMIIDGCLPPERAEELAAQVLDTFGQGVANPR
ncbi:TetR/AcrR family transcriptional regulator [Streptomyces sp. CB01881]|uniref:TetR/AcrR family transcriptional regulator n=1 Tax=Streptomyces sp. CB01881 TaxID=2078691 RepID=UPI000CDCC9BC|nr:TetR/AcrR family transcriptional regulator [Streptomyces sp. CB01881]AUY53098.1 TetR/AcrR family transcriptional regulator [Streptomyces sp. CB01881]TYC70814.1 TetR/AcrR family transcriptional regulator [Streptomyces sp. CB01881]